MKKEIGKNCFKPLNTKPRAWITKIKPMKMKMNRKAQMGLMVGLLMGFMVVTMFIALLPGFTEILDSAQDSDHLNCKGYVYNGNSGDPLSYNATIGTKSSVGCLGIKLYIPYLVLGVLVAVVSKILYDRGTSQPQQYYGG